MQISVLQETHLNAKLLCYFCRTLVNIQYNIDQCPGEITIHGSTSNYLIKEQKYITLVQDAP